MLYDRRGEPLVRPASTRVHPPNEFHPPSLRRPGRDSARHIETFHYFRPTPKLTTASMDAKLRHELEVDLHRWIDDRRPPPVAVLREIADRSPTHRSILLLIAAELERVPLPPPPPASPPQDSAYPRPSRAEVTAEINVLSDREDALSAMVDERTRERALLLDAIAQFKRVLAGETFERVHEQPRPMAPLKADRPVGAKRTELWGERQHLQDALLKARAELEAERAMQVQLAGIRGSARIERFD
jgi:hypothetical protein